MNIYGEYFYGNKISDYGIENGFVDYGTLAKAFDCVLNNDIVTFAYNHNLNIEQTSGTVDNSEEIEELEEQIAELEEQIEEKEDNGENTEELEEQIAELEEKKEELEEEQEREKEVFQWFIIADNGARILEEINEIVYYIEELDMYIWGVTHWGTSWDYVLTDIPCNTEKI